MAIAGLVTGYVGLAISIAWGLALIVPFVLLLLATASFGMGI